MIKTIQKNVQITEEQDEFLRRKAISFSKLVKNKIEEEMIKDGTRTANPESDTAATARTNANSDTH